jgi:transposase
MLSFKKEVLMKRTPGKTINARERYWIKIIEEARRYPKGVTEYCRVMNVSKNNYYFWFKRLKPSHPNWHDLTNRPEISTQPTESKKNDGGTLPSTEVTVKARRKKWSGAEKERILKEFDALSAGDLSAALRREGLYVHTLNKWRTQRDLTEIASNRRPNGSPNPLSAENKKLREENNRLGKKLQQANEIIQLQKKISEMFGMAIEAQ